MNLTFHEDPGHGWLQVPLDQLGGFQPSQFSYRDERNAFLEEDCDAQGWMDYVGLSPKDLRVSVIRHHGRAPCCSLARFQ